jgi:hypothetical protein
MTRKFDEHWLSTRIDEDFEQAERRAKRKAVRRLNAGLRRILKASIDQTWNWQPEPGSTWQDVVDGNSISSATALLRLNPDQLIEINGKIAWRRPYFGFFRFPKYLRQFSWEGHCFRSLKELRELVKNPPDRGN